MIRRDDLGARLGDDAVVLLLRCLGFLFLLFIVVVICNDVDAAVCNEDARERGRLGFAWDERSKFERTSLSEPAAAFPAKR